MRMRGERHMIQVMDELLGVVSHSVWTQWPRPTDPLCHPHTQPGSQARYRCAANASLRSIGVALSAAAEKHSAATAIDTDDPHLVHKAKKNSIA